MHLIISQSYKFTNVTVFIARQRIHKKWSYIPDPHTTNTKRASSQGPTAGPSSLFIYNLIQNTPLKTAQYTSGKLSHLPATARSLIDCLFNIKTTKDQFS